MVNRVRFQAEAAALSPPIDIQALSYAVAALGAFTSTGCVSARDKCYNQARELLDLCERQDNGGMLVSINTLQTCVLLALYEFKSPNFARLWMTLGRAIRLCKMMGLDTLDAHSSGTSAGLSKQPPQFRSSSLPLPVQWCWKSGDGPFGFSTFLMSRQLSGLPRRYPPSTLAR